MSNNYEKPKTLPPEELLEALGAVVGIRNRLAEDSATIDHKLTVMKAAGIEDDNPEVSFFAGQASMADRAVEALDLIFGGHNLKYDQNAADELIKRFFDPEQ